jgi:hypothetical protein
MRWCNQGESVTVSAAGNPGYSFTGWSGDLSGTVNPALVVMSGPRVITGNFSPDLYSLAVNVNPAGLGTVVRNPDKATYSNGDQVILTAKPNDGYSFKNWSGGATGEVNPVTVVIQGNVTVTANFDLTGSLEATPLEGLSAAGRQGGTFSPSGQTYMLRNRGQIPVKWKVSKKPRWVSLSLTSGSLAPGGEVQVEVSISNSAKQLKMGSYADTIVFSNTSNKSDTLSRSAAIAVSPPVKIYTFKTKPEGLQVIVDGAAYSSPKTFEWEVGSSHTLDAPSPQTSSSQTQYAFSSWNNRNPQNQTIVAPPSGKTYTANFKAQHLLTTSVNPPDGGTVNPSGTNWLNQGQRISVTAKPNEGYQFVNWSGDAAGSRSPANLTLGGPMTLVANFVRIGNPEMEDASPSASLESSASDLPIVGALENPADGKRVWGQKTIFGWALDGEGISKVKLLIDGQYVCDIPYGGLREDLKEAYPDYPNAEKGGFALVWNYSVLSPGVHVVQVDIQNMQGEILRLSANVMVRKFSADAITQVNPNEWLIPGVNLTLDGNSTTHDLTVEWSNESQAFEVVDVSAQ